MLENPIDSLRITARETENLLRSLEQATQTVDAGDNQRGENDRVEVGAEIVAVVKLLPVEARATQFRIRCRNISPGGVGFLHGQFIHEGTPCEIILINGKQQGFQMRAKVVRCRFIEKHIHEIGIAFNETVELDKIIGVAA